MLLVICYKFFLVHGCEGTYSFSCNNGALRIINLVKIIFSFRRGKRKENVSQMVSNVNDIVFFSVSLC